MDGLNQFNDFLTQQRQPHMPPEWKSQIPLDRNPESGCYWSHFQSNGQEGDNGYGPDRSKQGI